MDSHSEKTLVSHPRILDEDCSTVKKVLALLAQPLLLLAQVWNPKQCFCCEHCELQTQHLFKVVSSAIRDFLDLTSLPASPVVLSQDICLWKFNSAWIPVWILGSEVESSGPTTPTLAALVLLRVD